MSFPFMQNIMKTSQSLERDMSQNYSRKALAQKGSSLMDFTSAHPEHESLQSCHIASTSCNIPALPSNELCEFLDWERVVVLIRESHSDA
jgi:hypothetical protein